MGALNWTDEFRGTIWTLQQSLQPDGRVFERARRAPGSRIIIIKDNKVLLSREKRRELGGKTDNRLPGGKVFDKNEDYTAFLAANGDIVEESRQSIAKEALEEVGVVVKPEDLGYLGVDVLGATCSWDLHYWVAKIFTMHDNGAQYHETEEDEIEGSFWASFDEAKKLALSDESFAESRSAIMLLRLIESLNG